MGETTVDRLDIQTGDVRLFLDQVDIDPGAFVTRLSVYAAEKGIDPLSLVLSVLGQVNVEEYLGLAISLARMADSIVTYGSSRYCETNLKRLEVMVNQLDFRFSNLRSNPSYSPFCDKWENFRIVFRDSSCPQNTDGYWTHRVTD